MKNELVNEIEPLIHYSYQIKPHNIGKTGKLIVGVELSMEETIANPVRNISSFEDLKSSQDSLRLDNHGV